MRQQALRQDAASRIAAKESKMFGKIGLVTMCILGGTTMAGAIAPAEKPCTLGGVAVPALSVKALDTKHFRALHAAVAPRGEGERWAEIPWQPDLAEARRKAARENKPLLMWIMDGHPLGCT
jgi:hypothetical protein